MSESAVISICVFNHNRPRNFIRDRVQSVLEAEGYTVVNYACKDLPPSGCDIAITGSCSSSVVRRKLRRIKQLPTKVRVLFMHEVPSNVNVRNNTICEYVNYFIGSAGTTLPRDQGLQRVRYPYWALDSYQLRELTNQHPTMEGRVNRAVFIARNPDNGRRMALLHNIRKSTGLKVICPGEVGHNAPRIKVGSYAKREYIKGFVFNVCPENSDYPGYVTEKLLEACTMGCIPIYWGNSLEPGIINPARVIQCKSPTLLGAEAVGTINRLIESPEALLEFFDQPVFLPTAQATLAKIEDRLDNAIREMATAAGF